MRKLFLALVLFLSFVTPAFSQVQYFGPTVKQRDAVASADTWFNGSQAFPRTGSLELAGYNSVRIDADVSVNGATIVGNLAVSNDTIWVSGDSLTFTKDSYQDVILQGGKDYYFNIDSISSGNVTVYLTPFSQ